MEPVVGRLFATLRRQRGRLARSVRRTRRNPGESEVHRLRILTRRLRAIVRLVKDLPRSAPAARAGKRLRSLGRALGERRMWDVAMDAMARVQERPERFAPRRDAATRALMRELGRLDLSRLLDELKAAGKLLRGMPPDVVAARARRMRKAMGTALARRPARADARHAVRIRVKKARYLLEACGIAAPGARRLQSLLGDEHDLAVLRTLVGAGAELRRLEIVARKRSDRAFESALRATVELLEGLEHSLASGPRD